MIIRTKPPTAFHHMPANSVRARWVRRHGFRVPTLRMWNRVHEFRTMYRVDCVLRDQYQRQDICEWDRRRLGFDIQSNWRLMSAYTALNNWNIAYHIPLDIHPHLYTITSSLQDFLLKDYHLSDDAQRLMDLVRYADTSDIEKAMALLRSLDTSWEPHPDTYLRWLGFEDLHAGWIKRAVEELDNFEPLDGVD